jgi:hypothetical protein
MNSQHVINGWIAQLSFDARDRRAERTRGPAQAPAPVLVASAPIGDAVAVGPEEPSRPRPRRRSGRAWTREGRVGRAIAGPCLGLG